MKKERTPKNITEQRNSPKKAIKKERKSPKAITIANLTKVYY
jgi:hypothetical protein